jgi:glucokinase
MKPKPAHLMGIDLGGTRMKLGLVDGHGRILLSKNVPTCVELGLVKGIDRILGVIKKFQAASAKRGYPPQLIGLGAPGLINREKGLVHFSPNFPDWRDVPLVRIVNKAIGLPVFLDNDANVVTYGEKWMGAGKDLKNFLCLTLGTGVGSGLVLNDRLWYGSQTGGPEFGHITIIPGGLKCGCGNRGCLETLASASYLVKKAQRGLDRNVTTLLPRILSRGKDILSAEHLFEAARQGDRFCLALYANMGKYLGITLASIIHMLGLEGVVLGGGVSRAATIFLPYLEKEFKKRLTMASADQVSIRISTLGEKSGILGAAKMAMESHKKVYG